MEIRPPATLTASARTDEFIRYGARPLRHSGAVQLAVQQAGEPQVLQRLLRVLGLEKIVCPWIPDSQHRSTEEGTEAFLFVFAALTGGYGNSHTAA